MGWFEGGAYPETRLRNPDGQFRLLCAGRVPLLPMRYAACSPPPFVCEPLLPALSSSCAPRTSACSTESVFLFLPFLPCAPCQILGGATSHLSTFLPLSSFDPNVRVRKHIHFSDPQRRVPSSRFVASRQTNRLRDKRWASPFTRHFFFLWQTTQNITYTLLKCALLQLVTTQVLPEFVMRDVPTYKWAG